MIRKKSKRSLTFVDRNGTLAATLYQHATQRCLHYFYFLFRYQTLLNYSCRANIQKPVGEIVTNSETHQIDSGWRKNWKL